MLQPHQGHRMWKRMKRHKMLFRILEICECHVCERRSESSCTKTFKNHPFRHKESAKQRRSSRKRVRKRTTRHIEANCCNPEEGLIRFRIQTRQARETEIYLKEEGKKNCQLSLEGEEKRKNRDTIVELHLSLNRFH